MNIEVKSSVKPIDYLESIKILEKRVHDVFLGKKDEFLWVLEHNSVYTAGTINQHYASILKLWDVTSGSLIQTFMRSTYNYATALNPTWTQLATSSDTGYIHIWNIYVNICRTIFK